MGLSGKSRFNFVNHIFVSQSRLYLSDTFNHRILIFSLSRLKNQCKCGESAGPLPGLKPASFKYPRGVWADDEHLCVADSENNRLVIFPEPVPSIGTRPKIFTHCDAGTTPRGVKGPVGFTVISDKGVLLDHHNDRVLIFPSLMPRNGDRPAMVLKNFEWKGRCCSFQGPRDVAVNNRYFFVSDLGNDRIVALKREDLDL